MVSIARVAAVVLAAAATTQTSRAQEAWRGATCYAITVGEWRIEGDTTRQSPGRPPSTPTLLILEEVDVDQFIWGNAAEPGDTVLNVVHARSADGTPFESSFDPSFVWWRRPGPDSITVLFGTGFGGITFEFAQGADRLRGRVSELSDIVEPLWEASALGERTPCPRAPAQIGRLRLSATDSVDTEGELPFVNLSLTSETPHCAGAFIRTEATIGQDSIRLRVIGLHRERGDCSAASRRTVSPVMHVRRSGRTELLIRHEGTTNHFALTVADSTFGLTTVRSLNVVADEGTWTRPRHNLFRVSCGHRIARNLCDQFGHWLQRQPGIKAVDTATEAEKPFARRTNEDVRTAMFRYRSNSDFARVRACVESVAGRVRNAAGVYITIRTWLGEELTAWSDRSAQSSPSPDMVPSTLPCSDAK